MSAPATITRQPKIYSKRSDFSFFKDLAAISQVGSVDRHAAQERLTRHQRESRGLDGTAGQGGSFTPPGWIVSEFVGLIRGSRPFTDICSRFPLPPGLDSISLPKVSGGATVEIQPFPLTPVTSADLADTFVSSPVRTFSGQNDVSLQLAEQTGGNWDQAIFSELTADYGEKLDKQIIAGTGANGQLKGVDSVSGATSLVYTDATPTALELNPFIAEAIALVGGKRKQTATHIVMAPRRAAWLWDQSKSVGINFIDQGSDGRFINGLRLIEDPNIVCTQGAGGNEDRIYVVKADDLWLWESQPRLRALIEPLSATLQVRFQAFWYSAFIADRHPLSIATISGTGLALPSSTWGP